MRRSERLPEGESELRQGNFRGVCPKNGRKQQQDRDEPFPYNVTRRLGVAVFVGAKKERAERC